MLAAVPGAAKAITEQIDGNQPLTMRLADLKNTDVGKNITTNDFTALRRSIPFAGDQPIIPEIVPGRGRAMAYRKVDEKEFESYEFSDKNFMTLTSIEIGSMKRRIKQIDPEYDKKEFFRLMTICDIVIQQGGKDKYVEISPQFLACAILKDESEMWKTVKFLVRAGILSEYDKQLRYNSIYRDITNEDAPKFTSESEYQDKTNMKIRDLVEIEDKIDELKGFIHAHRAAFEMGTTPEGQLHKQIQYLKDELKKQQELASGYTVALSSYQEMSKEYEKLKQKNAKLEEAVEKYRSTRKTQLDRVQNIFEMFTQKMSDASKQFTRDGKEASFTFKVTNLVADAYKSISNVSAKI